MVMFWSWGFIKTFKSPSGLRDQNFIKYYTSSDTEFPRFDLNLRLKYFQITQNTESLAPKYWIFTSNRSIKDQSNRCSVVQHVENL